MKIKYTIWSLLLFSSLLISACYNYGNTHEPYGAPHKEYHLPPPPQKIVGTPDTKKEYMQKTYTEIKNTLQEADVVMIEDSIKVLFPDHIVYLSKDELPSSDYTTPLMNFSKLLLKYKKTNILVTGHSDNKGKELSNKALSAKRAENIKNILIQNGVASYRLKSWGIGSRSPVASNETKEGRDKNRRVEFVVLYQEK